MIRNVTEHAGNYDYIKLTSVPESSRMSQYYSSLKGATELSNLAPASLLSTKEIEQRLNTLDNGIDNSVFFFQEETCSASGAVLESVSMEKVASTRGNLYGSQAWFEAQAMLLCFNPAIGDLLDPYYMHGRDGVGPIFNCTSTLWAFEGQESSPDNPIFYAMSKGNEEWNWYKITINQIDPRNATHEEMFTLITYIHKDDPLSIVLATLDFAALDEEGARLGLFSEDQDKRDYVAIFQAFADICKGYLDSGEYSVHLRNLPQGATNYSQMSFEILLKIIDNILERSVKSKELAEREEHTDIDEPEELVDKQEPAKQN